ERAQRCTRPLATVTACLAGLVSWNNVGVITERWWRLLRKMLGSPGRYLAKEKHCARADKLYSLETARVDEESVRPTPGYSESIEGSNRCRLTCENRARGFHQGQSENAHKQAVYSDAVRPSTHQQRCPSGEVLIVNW